MFSVRQAALAAFVGMVSLAAAAAQAQVYRIVGPDGRVTFSDRPEGNAAQPVPQAGNVAAAGSASLPSELRNAAGRYPVTLYTGKECAPCDQARSFLVGRGIPYTEKTVTTDADARALRSLSGALSLPFATLGAQHLVGFADSEWSQYMDAAGYPRTSVLPPGYRNPPPVPMVAVQSPQAGSPTAQAVPSRAPVQPLQASPQPAPSAPSPANPAGIRF